MKYLSLAPIALVLSTPLFANTELNDIVVTASRTFDKTSAQSSFVVDREQIQASTAQTLTDIFRLIPGIQVRSLFGSISSEATVSLGGFGANSGQNTLILIDGQRQNDIDLSATDIGSLSLENIERIEVLPGSGGVLYGKGAVGGTINIVTRNKQRNATSVKVTLGSQQTRQIQLKHDLLAGATSGQLFFNQSESDGYRDNNAISRLETGAKLRHALNDSHSIYTTLLVTQQDSGLPGPRRVVRPGTTQFGFPVTAVNQLEDDPRGATSLTDYADTKRLQALVGWKWDMTPNTSLITEGGYRLKQQKALVFSYVDTDLHTYFANPRVESSHRLGQLSGQLTVGADISRSDYQSNRQASEQSPPIHALTVRAASQSFYAHENLFYKKTKLTLGARQSNSHLKANDRYVAANDPASSQAPCLPDFSNFPCFSPDGQAAPLRQTLRGELYEMALSQQITDSLEAGIGFAKSLRLPTVDDIFQGFGPNAGFAGFRQFSELNAQTGRNITAFVSKDFDQGSLRIDAYQNRLENEIAFNSVTFANENLDPTEHRGATVSGTLKLASSTELNASLGYQQARFRSGTDAGNDIPLVAKRIGSFGITQQLAPTLSLALSTSYVGQRRFDNDQSYTFGEKIPSSLRHDAKLTYIHEQLTLTAAVQNLSNARDNIDYAVRSGTPGIFNAFPLPGREVFVSGEYRF